MLDGTRAILLDKTIAYWPADNKFRLKGAFNEELRQFIRRIQLRYLEVIKSTLVQKLERNSASFTAFSQGTTNENRDHRDGRTRQMHVVVMFAIS